jgi:hypothetical protein
MWLNPVASIIVILVALSAGGILLFNRRLAASSLWRATVTPLASIMGSGFLVCAPLLYANVGNYAVLAMAGLLCLAYAVGSVIRFNIQYGEPFFEKRKVPVDIDRKDHRLHVAHRGVASGVEAAEATEFLERASHVVLSGAYCVSVSYYLQLLASFALAPLSLDKDWIGKLLVTVILTGIGIVGMARGLKGIERIERTVVSINLSLILALIAGLFYHNIAAASTGAWHLLHMSIPPDKTHVLRVLMGMLIVVQGFETSRFLGSEHPREERIRTMKWAQLLSAGTYILFILLMAVVINGSNSGGNTGITAIIGFSKVVAPILPVLLTITAIGSQFSAATADDAGCSGLLEAILRGRFTARFGYIIVSVAAVALTWSTDVYQIISYASRAFAFYYALQCIVAILVMKKAPSAHGSTLKAIVYGLLAAVCVFVTLFGIPAG